MSNLHWVSAGGATLQERLACSMLPHVASPSIAVPAVETRLQPGQHYNAEQQVMPMLGVCAGVTCRSKYLGVFDFVFGNTGMSCAAGKQS